MLEFCACACHDTTGANVLNFYKTRAGSDVYKTERIAIMMYRPIDCGSVIDGNGSIIGGKTMSIIDALKIIDMYDKF